MKRYPEPAPPNNFTLNEAALAAELDFPVAPDFDPPPPRVDPLAMLARFAETMPWRSTRPGEKERRLAQKIAADLKRSGLACALVGERRNPPRSLN